MGQTEIYIFIILSSLIVGTFITGIVLFMLQYRKRVKLYEQEKQLTEALHQSELQHAKIEIQQLTMSDIGRELHDGIGQRMTLASIYLRQINSQLSPEALNEKSKEVGQILLETLNELRGLSKELTTDQDHLLNLSGLLQTEIERLLALQICEIQYDLQQVSLIQSRKAKFIQRIFQEFVQNSLKYSACQKMDIRLMQQQDTITLQISDDGKGFDLNAEFHGIGIANMKKRAALIGAELDLHTSPGQGSRMQLQIHLNDH